MHARADTLVDVLTVEEMLMYTAELKRPLRESTKSKKQAVDALIEDLNLAGCRATRIGNSMHRGISGGQVSPAAGFPVKPCECHEGFLFDASGFQFRVVLLC